MARYKVIQDIEAEDKLVGPLTLKQFIYAAITALCGYICFLSITKHFPFAMAIFLPIGLLSGFFAFPWGREQPTEIWALAKIRFFFKPRRRVWDQSGVKELVTITAPKRIQTNYTNGLSQNEVNSRLKALAATIDSRGWAVKNVNVNLFSQPSEITTEASSDRLINPSSLPQEVPQVDIQASDDILDENSSPVAQHFEQMINDSEKEKRERIEANLKSASTPQPQAPPNDYWFMNQPDQVPPSQPGFARFDRTQVVAPGTPEEETSQKPTTDEAQLAATLKSHAHQPDISNSHLHTIQPLSEQPLTTNKPAPQSPAPAPVTHVPESVKMNLSNDNNRSVASIEHEANEVVISLH